MLASSPAVTVTVCAADQSAPVNVSDDLSTLTPSRSPVTATVTVAAGCVASFTVYVPVPPSVTARDDSLSTSALVSLSVVVTRTVAGLTEP